MAELRRLFTTFWYFVANQGAVAVIGLAYWAAATHLFGPTEVGLSAAAASTAPPLAAVGASGSRCSSWRKLNRSMPQSGGFLHDRKRDRSVCGPDPGHRHHRPVPRARAEPKNDRCRSRCSGALRHRVGGNNGGAHSRRCGGRTAPRRGAALARQPELHLEARMRRRPRPCVDAHRAPV